MGNGMDGYDFLNNKIKELEKENATLINNISILKGKIEMIEAAYKELEKENAALRIVNDGHKTDIANLKEQILEYDAANERLRKQIEKLKESNDDDYIINAKRIKKEAGK